MDQKSIKKKSKQGGATTAGQQLQATRESYAPEYYFGVCVSVL